MKGMVFTEFVEFVENRYGFDAVDGMIEDSGLSGVYTQAGNYPFEEMVTLVVALCEKQKVELVEVLEKYGEYLFGKLASLYPNINKFSSVFDIVSHVDNIIHPEVRKLYPDADLPSFRVVTQTENKLIMEYMSNKSLQHLAKGLILGVAQYYNENIVVNIQEDSNPILLEIIKS